PREDGHAASRGSTLLWKLPGAWRCLCILLKPPGILKRRSVMTLKATCWSLLLALLAVGAPAWAAKVDVCHIPPGDPSNLHTITISEHALQAHLAHGDFLGDCSADRK